VVDVVTGVNSCSRCAFSTLRYDKLKEHLHKQHKLGTAPERRVRITDMVNLDLAKTVEGVVSQPLAPPSQQLSLDVSDTPMVDRNISCVIDLNISTCAAKQQAVTDGSVIIVEPADFLLSNIHIEPLNDLATANETPEDVNMSAVLLDTDLVKEKLTMN